MLRTMNNITLIGLFLIFSGAYSFFIYEEFMSHRGSEGWKVSVDRELFGKAMVTTLSVGDETRSITFLCSAHEKRITYRDQLAFDEGTLEGAGKLLIEVDDSDPIILHAYSSSQDKLKVTVEALALNGDDFSNKYFSVLRTLQSATKHVKIVFTGIKVGQFDNTFEAFGAPHAVRDFISDCESIPKPKN